MRDEASKYECAEPFAAAEFDSLGRRLPESLCNALMLEASSVLVEKGVVAASCGLRGLMAGELTRLAWRLCWALPGTMEA